MGRRPKSPHPPRQPLIVLTSLGTRRGREFSDAFQRRLLEFRERHSWFPCVIDLVKAEPSDLLRDPEASVVLDSDQPEFEIKRLKIKPPKIVITGSNPSSNADQIEFVTDAELTGAIGADHLLRRGLRQFFLVTRQRKSHHESILHGFVSEMSEIEHNTRIIGIDEFSHECLGPDTGFLTLDDQAHRFVFEQLAETELERSRNLIQPADFSTTVDSTFPQILRDPAGTADAVISQLLRESSKNTERNSGVPIILPLTLPSRFQKLITQDNLVAEASRMIDEQIKEIDLSPGKVADQLNISRRTLERRFREVLGNSILQEIQRRRILKARILLTTDRIKPKNVASRCGFSSPRMLALAFQRFTGSKPRAYQSDFLSRSAVIFL